MSKIIARCGLICSECPAYIATRDNDDQARAEIAAKWSKEFQHDFKPEEINCDGCLTEGGRVIGYCRICEIRKCGSERSLANCGLCDEYPSCPKVTDFAAKAPSIREVLDNIAHERKAGA